MNIKEELLHCHLSGAKQSRYWAESLTPFQRQQATASLFFGETTGV